MKIPPSPLLPSTWQERVFLHVARELGVTLCVSPAKRRLLAHLDLPESDLKRLTTDPNVTRWHVVPMDQLRLDRLRTALRARADRYAALAAFRPSGWCAGRAGGRTVRSGNVTLHEVAYSEHSSFAELRQCVADLRPRKIVPTVGVGKRGEKVEPMIRLLTKSI